jgi:hypothetical protein
VNIADKVKRYGVMGTARRALQVGAKIGRNRYYRWNTRNAPKYANPTPAELAQIEKDLVSLGVRIYEYSPAKQAFEVFKSAQYFPLDYHGGPSGSVWDEKLLEHWITAAILDVMNYQPGDIYVDVAACSSPWAKVLRERMGISAFGIDLAVRDSYAALPFYRAEDATATSFEDGSVRGASLHCAYEMFLGSDDIDLVREMARILRPGGKLVVAPLYMHTHYCSYSTPEYYGKGYSDPEAKEYVRVDCFGVPSSRKYDAKTLMARVLKSIESLGMSYRLFALRNKEELGENIYCHFILEVTR